MFPKLAVLQISVLLPLVTYSKIISRGDTAIRAPTSQILKDTMNAFVVGGLVPDLLPRFEPIATMRVTYQPESVYSTVFFPGQRVPQELTKKQPKIQMRLPPDQSLGRHSAAYTLSVNATYTFVMIDPDVPSRINSSMGPFRHMLATQVKLIQNFPYFDLDLTNEPISPYEPPSPPEATGFHRYTFLLYSGQPSPGSLKKFNQGHSPDRFHFNLRQFVTEAGLSDPISGTFMSTENAKDESKNLAH